MNEHNHGHIHEHGEGQTHAHLNIAQEPAVSHAHAHNSQEAGDPHAHTHHQQEGHSHHHVHSEEEKRAVINRLSRAIGYLESVRRMVERDEDCSDVLIQLAAVKGELNKIGKDIIKQHLEHCLVHAIEDGDLSAVEHMNDAIEKFMK
jgi:DNA-binding FrmR family transcriptional regulator